MGKTNTVYTLISPVAFIIFNRPDKAQITFDAIAKARPKQLLVIADGARSHIVGEKERCEATRAIIDQVNWDCEVLKNYSESNLGCKQRLASGLDWVFNNVSEAIILEDDCLPTPSFFQYCDELLAYYRNDERIGMISGDNFQEGIWRGKGDYYFSRFCHIWGWATWARAWKKYDVNASSWPQLKARNWLGSLGFKGSEKKHWEEAFESVYTKRLDTWDHQWNLACWQNEMLAITPNVNLISNIGFGEGATHTKGPSIHSDMKTIDLQFPLKHPTEVTRNQAADNMSSRRLFTNSYLVRGIRKIKAILGIRK